MIEQIFIVITVVVVFSAMSYRIGLRKGFKDGAQYIIDRVEKKFGRGEG